MSEPVAPPHTAPEEIVTKLAERLRASYAGGEPIPPIRYELPDGDVAAAYQVQDVNTEHWLSTGRRAMGRKIGLTAASVQRQLGVDQPDFGILFADMVVDDGATVAAGRLLQPRVEAEVAFVLGRDLAVSEPTVVDVIGAVEYALPAIEIVDSRIAEWQIGIVDTVADNASSGMFVLGTTPRSVRDPDPDLDLRLVGMVMEVDEMPAQIGSTAAILGHPVRSLVAAARLVAAAGERLEAGDLVMAGGATEAVPLQPGARVRLRVERLGTVSFDLTKKEG